MPNNRWNDKAGVYPIATVTFRTVDQALQDYFTKKITLSVENGEGSRNKVPVIYAGAERWNSIQKSQGVRDENGTLILPLVSLRRTDVTRDKGFGGMASEQPYITVSRKLANKTAAFTKLVQTKNQTGFPTPKEAGDVYEYFTLPFPDFCTMYYEVTVWAQYQSQMNEIMEQIVYSYDYNDSFIMPVDYSENKYERKGYYFVGFNEGNFTYSSNFEEMTGAERLIKYIFRIKVPVYLILNPKNEPTAYGHDKGKKNSDNQPVVYKYEGATQITVSEKLVSNIPQEPANENPQNVKIVLK